MTVYAIADYSVQNPADWSLLDPLSRTSQMQQMHESLLPITELDLVCVERSETVDVDPAVRQFIDSSGKTPPLQGWG